MSTVATGYLFTSIVSVMMLAVAWRWPRAGRVLYASGAAPTATIAERVVRTVSA
jgi:hypothetical protein